MTAFKEVIYNICTDDYDDNEYLAVKCILVFFTNDTVWCF